jgi:hypothetical protein
LANLEGVLSSTHLQVANEAGQVFRDYRIGQDCLTCSGLVTEKKAAMCGGLLKQIPA